MKKANRTLAFIFLLVAVGVLTSIIIVSLLGSSARRAHQRIDVAIANLQHIEEALSTLKDAETGQRGYLLTGKESYLGPYRQALTNFAALRSQLERLVTSGDIPQSTFNAFDQLAQAKLDELALTIQLRREKGPDAALAVVDSGHGKEIMDHIRAQVAGISTDERAKIERLVSEADNKTIFTGLLTCAVGAADLVFIWFCYRRILREIRNRERAALEVARQKEILHTTLASIGDGVIVTDLAGHVTFLNAEAEKLTGWKRNEAIARPLTSVFRIINEDTRNTVENPVEKVLRLGTVVGLANHTLLITKDGREIPIDDSAAPIRLDDSPLFGVVLVFRDFSEHKKMEHEMAEANARLETTVHERTAKLREMISELEYLSYAIVHDMRAPLRSMHGFAQLLNSEDEVVTPEERKNFSERIMRAADRLDHLIQDALAYNKVVLQELPLKPVDVGRLVTGIIDTYPNLHPDKAAITVENSLPRVLGNEALLTQCLSNLLGNAVKFVAPSVKPEVRLRAEERDSIVRISVSDNGIGIPAEQLPRIFKMFERLSNNYEGTGIGLAIVKKAAERMGGTVGVDSSSGQGSTFWIELKMVK